MHRRLLRVIPLVLLATAMGTQAPAEAAKPSILNLNVDLTYLLSDVSLTPCSFPVLIHEFGRQIYGTFYDGAGNVSYFTIHGAEQIPFTNLDTGQTIVTFNAGQIRTIPAEVTDGPRGTIIVTFSDSFAGLNLLTSGGQVVIAGHGTSDYVLTFSSSFKLISFSITEVNTPKFEHSSDTICALLTPSV